MPKLIEKLAKVGIPVVFVDFRDKPFENTEPSMRLIGKLFGKETRAEEFIAFREGADRARHRASRQGQCRKARW